MKILMITKETPLENHISEIWETVGAEIVGFAVENTPGNTFTLRKPNKQEELAMRIVMRDYDFVFSVGYDHEVSSFCQMAGKPYVSYVIDLPNYDLFRNSIYNACNIIFIADSWWAEHLTSLGAREVYYLPAAAMYVNETEPISDVVYAYPASYIGKVEPCGANTVFADPVADLSVLGYMDALVHSQRVYYGKEIVSSAISGALLNKLTEYYPLNAPGDTILNSKELYNWMQVVPQLDREQRRIDLSFLGNVVDNSAEQPFKYTAFTGQDTDDELVTFDVKPFPSSEEEKRNIIAATSANIECISRHYINGISRHAFDIMGMGGALVTNASADMHELFVSGEDYLEYSSGTACSVLAWNVYKNSEIRNTIRKNGYNKVREAHTYTHRINEILRII